MADGNRGAVGSGDGTASPSSAPQQEGEGFDAVIERLRAVVERLEGGSLSLEQSLQAFEDGVRLSRRGSAILDQAERRVELLLRGPETGAGGAGSDRTVPFEPGGDGDELREGD